MFVVVNDVHSSEILYQRQISPTESLDLLKFAELVAEEYDSEIDDSPGYVPSCSGDIRVEFRHSMKETGSIWSGQSYYFKIDTV
jgi:hypothetical protein